MTPNASVHKGLKQKKSAEPPRRVIHRQGRAVQIARSGKPDEAVAQILALQKNEDDEDDDDEGRLQRRKRGSGDGLHNGERPPRSLVNLDRDRRLVFLALGQLVLWLSEGAGALEDAGRCGSILPGFSAADAFERPGAGG